ncbi:MAG TPA: class I SAM-dependent methyltransferase, partial [Bacteroidia bacterium]|nr:class I SAM-dependent methyltransferase [Bacteroidia bacterium]
MSNESNRMEWIQKQLKKLPAGSRILDAGAGEQPHRPYCAHLNYVSQDFAQYNPEKLDSGLQMEKWDYGKLDIISDITAIPEPDGSFDAILCSEVFEHIPDPNAAVKEFSRLLRKGGTLILT